MLVDTHTHLQFDAFEADRERVVERAREVGVTRLVAIGTDLADSSAAVALAARYPGVVYATVGVHPNAAGEFDGEALAALRDLAARPGVVAIGEVGLDCYRDRVPLERQQAAFAAQQSLALELGLPLVVHCRQAHDAVHTALTEAGGYGTRVVIHCFTSAAEAVEQFLAAGCWIGMDGPVTYPSADEARTIAARVPLDRLLLETDCPYLAPQAHRGRRCEPAYVALVADAVAAVRGLEPAALATATTANAERFFGW